MPVLSADTWNGQCEQSLLNNNRLHVTCCSLQIQGNWNSLGKIVCISLPNSHLAFRVCVFCVVPYLSPRLTGRLIWTEDIFTVVAVLIWSFEYWVPNASPSWKKFTMKMLPLRVVSWLGSHQKSFYFFNTKMQLLRRPIYFRYTYDTYIKNFSSYSMI